MLHVSAAWAKKKLAPVIDLLLVLCVFCAILAVFHMTTGGAFVLGSRKEGGTIHFKTFVKSEQTDVDAPN